MAAYHPIYSSLWTQSKNRRKQERRLIRSYTRFDYSSSSVERRLKHYNLDAIISVGYRVNSTRATRFRQWATRVLREHLTQGYSLDRQRFEKNAAELEAALALVKKAAAGEALTAGQGRW